eukprot:m.180038 g.180038  ORF g.180038 m.180038 type:complete len:392 (+) comp53437_c0_seq4:344-1519(+)
MSLVLAGFRAAIERDELSEVVRLQLGHLEGDTGLRQLTPHIVRCVNLVSLVLANCQLEEMSCLRAISACRKLKSIYLGGNLIEDASEAFLGLAQCTQLEAVFFDKNRLHDGNSQAICLLLGNCQKLRHVWLNDNRFTPAVLPAIARATHNHLALLDISVTENKNQLNDLQELFATLPPVGHLTKRATRMESLAEAHRYVHAPFLHRQYFCQLRLQALHHHTHQHEHAECYSALQGDEALNHDECDAHYRIMQALANQSTEQLGEVAERSTSPLSFMPRAHYYHQDHSHHHLHEDLDDDQSEASEHSDHIEANGESPIPFQHYHKDLHFAPSWSNDTAGVSPAPHSSWSQTDSHLASETNDIDLERHEHGLSFYTPPALRMTFDDSDMLDFF